MNEQAKFLIAFVRGWNGQGRQSKRMRSLVGKDLVVRRLQHLRHRAPSHGIGGRSCERELEVVQSNVHNQVVCGSVLVDARQRVSTVRTSMEDGGSRGVGGRHTHGSSNAVAVVVQEVAAQREGGVWML